MLGLQRRTGTHQKLEPINLFHCRRLYIAWTCHCKGILHSKALIVVPSKDEIRIASRPSQICFEQWLAWVLGTCQLCKLGGRTEGRTHSILQIENKDWCWSTYGTKSSVVLAWIHRPSLSTSWVFNASHCRKIDEFSTSAFCPRQIPHFSCYSKIREIHICKCGKSSPTRHRSSTLGFYWMAWNDKESSTRPHQPKSLPRACYVWLQWSGAILTQRW